MNSVCTSLLQAGFSFDFCVNFVKATGSSNAIKGILTMFGISPCFLGFSVATYPLRGWDYTLTLYAQILFIKITISWDLATDQDRDLCDHFCHCYPGETRQEFCMLRVSLETDLLLG
jgi:hypothetical protein